MKKLMILLALFFAGLACKSGNREPSEITGDPIIAAVRASQLRSFRSKLDSLTPSLKIWLKTKGFNSEVAVIGDLSMHSGLPRLVVWDINQRTILDSGLVAHGSGRQVFAQEAVFSNAVNSHCSSLGRYRIGHAYNGRFGKAFKLHGLDPTNSNAFKRFVVLHAYDCVPDAELFPDVLCNSQGCPMVSYAFLYRLATRIEASKRPMLLMMVK